MFDILKACHNESCCGYFSNKRIAYKIIHLGYYWPTPFRDTKRYVRSCDSCHKMGFPIATNAMPLHPQVLVKPFEKWALDLIGPINPLSKKKKVHICLHILCYQMGGCKMSTMCN